MVAVDNNKLEAGSSDSLNFELPELPELKDIDQKNLWE